jgi:hypothetical protein
VSEFQSFSDLIIPFSIYILLFVITIRLAIKLNRHLLGIVLSSIFFTPVFPLIYLLILKGNPNFKPSALANPKTMAMSVGNVSVGDKAIICPFCQTKGSVKTKKKKEASPWKMGAAALTFGLSTTLTGTNKQKIQIEARCSTCGQIWDLASRA